MLSSSLHETKFSHGLTAPLEIKLHSTKALPLNFTFVRGQGSTHFMSVGDPHQTRSAQCAWQKVQLSSFCKTLRHGIRGKYLGASFILFSFFAGLSSSETDNLKFFVATELGALLLCWECQCMESQLTKKSGARKVCFHILAVRQFHFQTFSRTTAVRKGLPVHFSYVEKCKYILRCIHQFEEVTT